MEEKSGPGLEFQLSKAQKEVSFREQALAVLLQLKKNAADQKNKLIIDPKASETDKNTAWTKLGEIDKRVDEANAKLNMATAELAKLQSGEMKIRANQELATEKPTTQDEPKDPQRAALQQEITTLSAELQNQQDIYSTNLDFVTSGKAQQEIGAAEQTLRTFNESFSQEVRKLQKKAETSPEQAEADYKKLLANQKNLESAVQTAQKNLKNANELQYAALQQTHILEPALSEARQKMNEYDEVTNLPDDEGELTALLQKTIDEIAKLSTALDYGEVKIKRDSLKPADIRFAGTGGESQSNPYANLGEQRKNLIAAGRKRDVLQQKRDAIQSKLASIKQEQPAESSQPLPVEAPPQPDTPPQPEAPSQRVETPPVEISPQPVETPRPVEPRLQRPTATPQKAEAPSPKPLEIRVTVLASIDRGRVSNAQALKETIQDQKSIEGLRALLKNMPEQSLILPSDPIKGRFFGSTESYISINKTALQKAVIAIAEKNGTVDTANLPQWLQAVLKGNEKSGFDDM